MILHKIEFNEHQGKPNYWKISGVTFGKANLIVGLNATGKTRLFNVINNLGQVLAKRRPVFSEGSWQLEFIKGDGKKFIYELEIHEGKIQKELIRIGKKIYLKRVEGKCEIFSFIIDKKIKITPPENELILHVRRDIKDYPFLEDLFNWASNVFGYVFTFARSDLLLIDDTKKNLPPHDLSVVPMILKNILSSNEPEKLTSKIVKDICEIGYNIEAIGLNQIPVLEHNKFADAIFVKEKGIDVEINQMYISQGMYRAISLVIIINFLKFTNDNCCLLIDDIGEGLDFQRSTNLTEKLFEIIHDTNIQLIITSNERYLINKTNTKQINILERTAHEVKAYNYENSKKIFKDFEYTGLTNFDLFRTEMYKKYE